MAQIFRKSSNGFARAVIVGANHYTAKACAVPIDKTRGSITGNDAIDPILRHAASPAAWPLAQAHWKLNPPS